MISVQIILNKISRRTLNLIQTKMRMFLFRNIEHILGYQTSTIVTSHDKMHIDCINIDIFLQV